MKDLENKIKNAKALREKELKDAEDSVTKAKKKMEESSKKMKGKYQVPTWVKVFRIIPEFRILRRTFHRKSASKC